MGLIEARAHLAALEKEEEVIEFRRADLLTGCERSIEVEHEEENLARRAAEIHTEIRNIRTRIKSLEQTLLERDEQIAQILESGVYTEPWAILETADGPIDVWEFMMK